MSLEHGLCAFPPAMAGGTLSAEPGPVFITGPGRLVPQIKGDRTYWEARLGETTVQHNDTGNLAFC